MEATIKHMMREAHQNADALAYLGTKQDEDLVVVDDMPRAIRSFVWEDALGISVYRDTKN